MLVAHRGFRQTCGRPGMSGDANPTASVRIGILPSLRYTLISRLYDRATYGGGKKTVQLGIERIAGEKCERRGRLG